MEEKQEEGLDLRQRKTRRQLFVNSYPVVHLSGENYRNNIFRVDVEQFVFYLAVPILGVFESIECWIVCQRNIFIDPDKLASVLELVSYNNALAGYSL